ncbi:hypothetical protein BpHYR1_019928 [Brachionus plicatilis]|uniref:Uncharacterized protein n=1 Tax=Brachionus plicatilis TaxID=10195 RepID=A0A3M7RYF3_BRAPC|nr:hypothetical protein BpHYR1_019928 [Brachionus plicatilis]
MFICNRKFFFLEKIPINWLLEFLETEKKKHKLTASLCRSASFQTLDLTQETTKILSTLSGLSLFLRSLIVFPAAENSCSEGTFNCFLFYIQNFILLCFKFDKFKCYLFTTLNVIKDSKPFKQGQYRSGNQGSSFCRAKDLIFQIKFLTLFEKIQVLILTSTLTTWKIKGTFGPHNYYLERQKIHDLDLRKKNFKVLDFFFNDLDFILRISNNSDNDAKK